MKDAYLGVDTSNYTTSLALIDSNNKVIYDLRRILYVEKGKKGLRQQEALFQHIKNLPQIFKQMKMEEYTIKSIGVSTRPRNVKGSYMPCFLAGESFGKSLSHALNTPYKAFSHQEGHLGTCLIDKGLKGQFLGLHLSGGTTESIWGSNNVDNLSISPLGGSLDISFGQLIDRLGVKIGLNFPCGRELEALSNGGKRLNIKIPYKTIDGFFNISGLENYFIKLITSSTYKEEDIFYTLFLTLADLIRDLILYELSKRPVENIYIFGGVISNEIIRSKVKKDLSSYNIIFANKNLSSDNAVGLAYLAKEKNGWEGE